MSCHQKPGVVQHIFAHHLRRHGCEVSLDMLRPFDAKPHIRTPHYRCGCGQLWYRFPGERRMSTIEPAKHRKEAA